MDRQRELDETARLYREQHGTDAPSGADSFADWLREKDEPSQRPDVYVVVLRDMNISEVDVIGVYESAADAQRASESEECSGDGDCDVFVFGPMPAMSPTNAEEYRASLATLRKGEIARRLSALFGRTVAVNDSDNGDADWEWPVYAEFPDDPDQNSYGLCDLFADSVDEQVAFLAEQLREGIVAAIESTPQTYVVAEPWGRKGFRCLSCNADLTRGEAYAHECAALPT